MGLWQAWGGTIMRAGALGQAPLHKESWQLAEVAEWHTRRSQKPLGATLCRFDPDLRHHMNKTRTITIVPYDPQWPLVFAGLKRIIERTLGSLAVSVEHVGSTSVPGLPAKPIIDLDVVIEHEGLLPDVVARLETLGYVHEGDKGIAGREAFDNTGADVPRDGSDRVWQDHHLYVCAQNTSELVRHLAFRDFLRTHPSDAAAYARLKRQLAERFPHDIDSYSRGKNDFVAAVLERHEADGAL